MAKTITSKEELTPLNSGSKRVNWIMGIVAAIVVTMVVSSFTVRQDESKKIEYSYEAVKRLEKDYSGVVSKEQFDEYKVYQQEKFVEIKQDFDEVKQGQDKLIEDIGEIKGILKSM